MKISSLFKFVSASLCVLALSAGVVKSPTVYAYSDLDGYAYKTAADYLTEQGVIGGYEDGTLRPDNSINRAEFLKIVMLAGGHEVSDEAATSCFTDVSDQWFAPYVCGAKDADIVNGHADGSFAPEETITLVEALKITTLALDLPMQTPTGSEWFSQYLETFAKKNYIPATLDYYSEELTRGEAFEILWRAMTDNETQDATTFDEFKGNACEDFSVETYSDIDMQRVRDTWLSWTNTARAQNGLDAYEYDTQLERTAIVWSEYGRTQGRMTHTRPGTTAYYDYYAIQDWFENLGLTFKNSGGYTFTENIGRGPYSCSADECTDELIAAIKYTFDYYMSEAGSSYAPHYNSIMNSQFQKIGFGLVVSDSSYFMTIHYATEITSTVAPSCD